MSEASDRTKVLSIRVTNSELIRYKNDAEIAGITLSEYVRRKLNGNKIVAKIPLTDRQTIANIRQIGGMIKQLFRYNKITRLELENYLSQISFIIDKIVKN